MLCYTCLWIKYLKFLIGISSFSSRTSDHTYGSMCWKILVVPHTLHFSPPKYKHTSEPGPGGDLDVYSVFE